MLTVGGCVRWPVVEVVKVVEVVVGKVVEAYSHPWRLIVDGGWALQLAHAMGTSVSRMIVCLRVLSPVEADIRRPCYAGIRRVRFVNGIWI